MEGGGRSELVFTMAITTAKPTASFVGGNVSALETLPGDGENPIDADLQDQDASDLDSYRLLFENNVQPMFILDQASLRVLAVNRAALRHYGFSRPEFLRLTLRDLCSSQHLPDLGPPETGSWAGNALGVWAHQKKSGATFQAEIVQSAVLFQGRNAVMNIVRDVTVQRALEQRQALQRLLAGLLANAEGVADCSRQLLETISRQLGWDSGEIWQIDPVSKEPCCVASWHAPEPHMEWFSRQLADDMQAVAMEKMWARSEPFWINDLEHNREWPRADAALLAGLQTVAGFPLRNGRRVIGGVLFYSRERRPVDRALLDTFAVLGSQVGQFMRQKQAEEDLRQREELFRSLIENAMETVSVIDSHGRIRYGSPAVGRVLGYRPAEITGRNIFELVHPEDVPWVLRLFERQPHEPGALTTIEYRIRHKDGSWRILEAVAKNCLNDPTVTGIIINSRDITERKEAEEQILRFNDLLAGRIARRTAELKAVTAELRGEVSTRKNLERELLAISDAEQRRIGQDLHDGLNQYLASIHYFCHSLHRKLQARAVQEAEDVKRICGLLDKAMTQTRQLARGLHPVKLDQPDGLASALADLAAATTELFDINCQFECAGPVHLADCQSATHLYRIAQEAIHNAIKHGAARHIAIACARTAAGVTLTVRNDGQSITRSVRQSRGMGLDTMSCRAKAIGAVLTIRPAKPRGTLVTCTLPATALRKASQSYESKDQERGHQGRRQKKHSVGG